MRKKYRSFTIKLLRFKFDIWWRWWWWRRHSTLDNKMKLFVNQNEIQHNFNSLSIFHIPLHSHIHPGKIFINNVTSLKAKEVCVLFKHKLDVRQWRRNDKLKFMLFAFMELWNVDDVCSSLCLSFSFCKSYTLTDYDERSGKCVFLFYDFTPFLIALLDFWLSYK